jgi:hypothetical protein
MRKTCEEVVCDSVGEIMVVRICANNDEWQDRNGEGGPRSLIRHRRDRAKKAITEANQIPIEPVPSFSHSSAPYMCAHR